MKKLQDYIPEGKDIEDVIEEWTPEERDYFNKEATRLLAKCDELRAKHNLKDII